MTAKIVNVIAEIKSVLELRKNWVDYLENSTYVEGKYEKSCKNL